MALFHSRWIVIAPQSLTTRKDHIKQQKRRLAIGDPLRKGKPSDICVVGDVPGPQDLIVQLTKIYFSAF